MGRGRTPGRIRRDSRRYRLANRCLTCRGRTEVSGELLAPVVDPGRQVREQPPLAVREAQDTTRADARAAAGGWRRGPIARRTGASARRGPARAPFRRTRARSTPAEP